MRHASFKAAAAAGVREKSTKNSAGNEAQFTKKERHSALIHPLFAKEKGGKEEQVQQKKATSPSSAKSAAKAAPGSKQPDAKPPRKPSRKLRQQQASSGDEAKAVPVATPVKKASKPAPAQSAASGNARPAAVGVGQESKLAREKGPKQQMAFAQAPTKLRMAPVSPDAIADPYRLQYGSFIPFDNFISEH